MIAPSCRALCFADNVLKKLMPGRRSMWVILVPHPTDFPLDPAEINGKTFWVYSGHWTAYEMIQDLHDVIKSGIEGWRIHQRDYPAQ